MDDDFNAPVAIAALFDLARGVNTALNAEAPPGRPRSKRPTRSTASMGGQVLGVVPEPRPPAAAPARSARPA